MSHCFATCIRATAQQHRDVFCLHAGRRRADGSGTHNGSVSLFNCERPRLLKELGSRIHSQLLAGSRELTCAEPACAVTLAICMPRLRAARLAETSYSNARLAAHARAWASQLGEALN